MPRCSHLQPWARKGTEVERRLPRGSLSTAVAVAVLAVGGTAATAAVAGRPAVKAVERPAVAGRMVEAGRLVDSGRTAGSGKLAVAARPAGSVGRLVQTAAA